MGKLKYLARQLITIDLKRLNATIRDCASRAHKSRLFIARDMVRCALRYTAAPGDYALFEFYRLSADQRASYITRGINNTLVKRYNPTKNWHSFDNKDEFNALFENYLKRDWLRADTAPYAAFLRFVQKHPVFFYKPRNAACGEGIEKLDAAAFGDKLKLYNALRAKGEGILEQPIEQHAALKRLYGGSVNTLRLVTIRRDNAVETLFGFLRIGNGGVVDNINAGGMAAPIDLDTGVVIGPGADKRHNRYTAHPKTGVSIVGFAIPRFAEALALVERAAQKSAGVNYIAWDVAMTERGPCLVEGNCYPGYDILQLPPHLKYGYGMLSRLAPYLGDNLIDIQKSSQSWNEFGNLQQ